MGSGSTIYFNRTTWRSQRGMGKAAYTTMLQRMDVTSLTVELITAPETRRNEPFVVWFGGILPPKRHIQILSLHHYLTNMFFFVWIHLPVGMMSWLFPDLCPKKTYSIYYIYITRCCLAPHMAPLGTLYAWARQCSFTIDRIFLSKLCIPCESRDLQQRCETTYLQHGFCLFLLSWKFDT